MSHMPFIFWASFSYFFIFLSFSFPVFSFFLRLFSILKICIQRKYLTNLPPLTNKQLFQYVCVFIQLTAYTYYFRNWINSTTFAIVGCLPLQILAQIELPRNKRNKHIQDFSTFAMVFSAICLGFDFHAPCL